jgi:hypothetical protein
MRLFFAISAFALLAAGAAYAGPRNVSGFTAVEARAGTNVEVTIGGAFSVDVSGPDAERIITRVSGGTLIVEPRSGWSWRGPRNARIRVTMRRAEGLAASSGADLVATGVNGGAVNLTSSSGADLRVSGECATFSADASSGADLHATNLRCETGNVSVSSGADARVFASNRLNVEASSGGGVLAYGGASTGNIELSSGGSFRRAN